MTLRYDRYYDYLGWLVQVDPGAKIRRTSGYGALDTPVIDVVILGVLHDPYDAGRQLGNSFTVLVEQLEEIEEAS